MERIDFVHVRRIFERLTDENFSEGRRTFDKLDDFYYFGNFFFWELHKDFEGHDVYELASDDVVVSFKMLIGNKCLIGVKRENDYTSCEFYIYNGSNLEKNDVPKIVGAIYDIFNTHYYHDPFQYDTFKKAEVVIRNINRDINSMMFIKNILQQYRFEVPKEPYCYETIFKTKNGDKLCKLTKIDDFRVRFFISDIIDVIIKIINSDEEYYKDDTCDIQVKHSEQYYLYMEIVGMLRMLRRQEEIINNVKIDEISDKSKIKRENQKIGRTFVPV